MGKTEIEEEPQQLSLEEEKRDKEKAKREEEKHQKPDTKIWVVVILFLTIIVSLVFYFVSGRKVPVRSEQSQKVQPDGRVRPSSEKNSWGAKIYEF